MAVGQFQGRAPWVSGSVGVPPIVGFRGPKLIGFDFEFWFPSTDA